MTERRLKWEQRVFSQVLQAFMLLGVALFQTSLAPGFWRFRVDCMLLLVVSWTLLRGLQSGTRWALYGGVSLDLLGSMPLGSHLLALMLCVGVVAVLAEPLEREQPMLVLLAMLISTFLYGFTLMLIVQATGGTIPWQRYPLVVVVPTALIDTAVALPTFALLRRLLWRGEPIASELL